MYFSKTSCCAGTLTKNPLMYTTPSDIFAIEVLPTGVTLWGATLKWLLFEVSSVTSPSLLNPHGANSSSPENAKELFASVPCLSNLI